jgi:hypothetical protein
VAEENKKQSSLTEKENLFAQSERTKGDVDYVCDGKEAECNWRKKFDVFSLKV